MTNVLEMAPVFTGANVGEWIELGDHRGRILVSSAQTNGAFLLCEVEVDAGGGVPPHIHSIEDETFYILQGDFEITAGGETVKATNGDTSFAPRHIPHTWRCTSEGGGRFLLLVTPGESFEHFVLEMAAQKITPLDANCIPALCALAAQHGMTMLPPEA